MPPPTWLRWLVLVLISLTMFGNYYIYDSISPLADLLKSQLGFSDQQLGTLNGIYSLPNIFMVLIGGIIIDRFGVRRSLFAFTLIWMMGAAVTAFQGDFVTMALGRLIFGLGAESMIVAVSAAIVQWFKGRELSLAFALNLTIARFGSFAALNSPTWARELYSDWQPPLIAGLLISLISVTAATVYWITDRSAGSRYTLNRPEPSDRVAWADILRFGRSYWLIVGLCATFYSAIFPFQTFAVKFFMEAHGVTREQGGFLSSLLTLFAMIFTPLFGYLSDRIGHRSALMALGSALLAPVYLMMGYTGMSLYIPVCMMGIAFSLIPAVMWPSVAYVVGDSRVGTAYGLMTMLQNVGLTAFNFLIGWANDFSAAGPDNPEGYRLGLWLFSVLGILGMGFAVGLNRVEAGPCGRGLDRVKIGGGGQGSDR